jgi:hypothetical protein
MDQATLLLRYRFETVGQLERHLHALDGRTLIFVPDTKLSMAAAGRVLIDLIVRQPAYQMTVRGEVVSRVEGGAWVLLSDGRLAERLRHGAIEGRREPRLSADALLQLRDSTGTLLIAQLLDLGTGGIRVRGAGRLLEGETYSVRLLNVPPESSDLGTAQVVRVEGAEAGMRFVSPRRPQVPLYLGALLEAWMDAPEIDHPAGCCGPRGLHEPPLPDLGAAAPGV